jgi:hypothetical protein
MTLYGLLSVAYVASRDFAVVACRARWPGSVEKDEIARQQFRHRRNHRVMQADGYGGFSKLYDGGRVLEAACLARVRDGGKLPALDGVKFPSRCGRSVVR